MAKIQIKCIVLKEGRSGHEHIEHVGTSVGSLPVSRVISMIDNGDEFYVLDQATGKSVEVHVNGKSGASSKPYIQTKADGIFTNNLLSLPRCSEKS